MSAIAYEWGRLIWSLNHNAGAVQALAAIAVALLTAVLIGITWWYARSTREMARTMERQLNTSERQSQTMERQLNAVERQLAASFQPDIGLTFFHNTFGRFRRDNIETETVSGQLTILNRSAFPVKLQARHIIVWFSDPQYGFVQDDGYYADLFLAPNGTSEGLYQITVPPGAAGVERHRMVVVVFSDLAGVSQHWFSMTDNGAISHHAPPSVFNHWSSTKQQYFQFLNYIKALNLPDGYIPYPFAEESSSIG
jgi:hypothetical protein